MAEMLIGAIGTGGGKVDIPSLATRYLPKNPVQPKTVATWPVTALLPAGPYEMTGFNECGRTATSDADRCENNHQDFESLVLNLCSPLRRSLVASALEGEALLVRESSSLHNCSSQLWSRGHGIYRSSYMEDHEGFELQGSHRPVLTHVKRFSQRLARVYVQQYSISSKARAPE
jgi:hypothetical protein